MNNVLKFPERPIGWVAIEKSIRESVFAAGGSAELCAFLIRRLQTDYQAINPITIEISVPDGCEKAVLDIAQFFKDRLAEAFTQLLLAHTDVFLEMQKR